MQKLRLVLAAKFVGPITTQFRSVRLVLASTKYWRPTCAVQFKQTLVGVTISSEGTTVLVPAGPFTVMVTGLETVDSPKLSVPRAVRTKRPARTLLQTMLYGLFVATPTR